MTRPADGAIARTVGCRTSPPPGAEPPKNLKTDEQPHAPGITANHSHLAGGTATPIGVEGGIAIGGAVARRGQA